MSQAFFARQHEVVQVKVAGADVAQVASAGRNGQVRLPQPLTGDRAQRSAFAIEQVHRAVQHPADVLPSGNQR